MRSYSLLPNGTLEVGTAPLTTDLLSNTSISPFEYSHIDSFQDIYFGDSEVFMCGSLQSPNKIFCLACNIVRRVHNLMQFVPTDIVTTGICFSSEKNLLVCIFDGSANIPMWVITNSLYNEISYSQNLEGCSDKTTQGLRYLYSKLLELTNITKREVFMEVHSKVHEKSAKDIVCLMCCNPRQSANKFIVSTYKLSEGYWC